MTIFAAGAAFAVAAALLRFAAGVAAQPRRWMVVLIVVAAAAGALVAESSPTGWVPLDALVRAGLGAAMAVAGAAVPAAALPAAAAACAALAVALSDAAPAAGAALGLAGAPALSGERSPLLGAAAGGLAAQFVFRIEWPVVTGASLAAGALIASQLLVPALRTLPGSVRRRIAVAMGAAAAACVVAGVAAGLAAASVANDIEDGIDAAVLGLDLVADDPDGARVALIEAADHFARAESRLDSWWARPSHAVPIVAQQARAMATMAAAGTDLTRTAADAVVEADIDSVRPVDGGVDLAALDALRGPLGRTAASLEHARRALEEVSSPWLLAPVADRHALLSDRVASASMAATTAALASDLVPDMLGADGPRRYLLLVQQPAEARGSGGLPGNWGEVVADEGHLDLVRFGRLDDLIEASGPFEDREVTMPASYDQLYGYSGIDLRWQNVTLAPDFPSAAELARQLWAITGGEPLDGVIAIDPFAVAALLEVVGPLELPGGTRLGPEDAPDFLLHEQYLAFPNDPAGRNERIDLLGVAAERAWAAFQSSELPGPGALAAELGSAVRGRHLQIAAFDDREADLLDRIGTSGALPVPVGDGAGAVVVNLGLNKIDYYLDRNTDYRATWDPGSGRVTGTFGLDLVNSAPADGEPDSVIRWGGTVDHQPQPAPGENLLQVYVHTALPATAVRIAGVPSSTAPTVRDGPWFVTVVVAIVPPGGTVRIEVDVDGVLPDERVWRFDAVRQPSINGDDLHVEIQLAEGWALVGGGTSIVADAVLAEPVTLRGAARTTGSVGQIRGR